MKKYPQFTLVLLFPYAVAFGIIGLYRGLFSNMDWIDDFTLFFFLLLIYLAALVCTVVTFVKSLAGERSGLELLRVSMIIKLLHIPSYILIFGISLLGLLFIRMLYITMFMILFDCMTIFLTGLVGLCGIIRSLREGKLEKGAAVIHGILQFIFCADVVSSIVVYRRAKRAVDAGV